jgi:hypothetical protein
MRPTVLTLLAAWPLVGFATESSVDPETGLTTWQTENQGIQVRLTQITPDQARAFYQARGFSREAAEHYASECVFMTVVRNIGDRPVDHRLADWRYLSAAQPPRPIRSKDEWEALWSQLGVAEAARIAFAWAQFPTEQRFAPGDWNQGMTTYSVPRGGPLDLHFVWHVGGTTLSGKLEQVRCADENP